MRKNNQRNTKGKIITAAWKLFYDQGFDNTTVEDIVFESGTSKGSFYHYFESKDALLGSLSDMFDEKYAELMGSMDPGMDAADKLVWLNSEMFKLIDQTVSVDLLSRLLSTQVMNHGGTTLLDHSRFYFRLLRSIISDGQKKGQLTCDLSTDQLINDYAMIERALMYDWCLNDGAYDLSEYSGRILPAFLSRYRK